MDHEPMRIDEDAAARDERIDQAAADYFRAREEGLDVEPREWVDRHPDLAPELEELLKNEELFTAMISNEAGERFGGFRVIRVIGRGGMGVVHEAEDSVSGRRVALKVLPTLGALDPTARARFRLEAEVASRLDQTNIIRVLDWGEEAGVPYLVMPLIDGLDLRAVIRRLRNENDEARAAFRVILPESPEDEAELAVDRPRWPAAALVGIQAADALAHAHSRSVLHRDVKPSNLLIGADGIVRVVDFGLARSGEDADLTETGDIAGTLRFAAPERFKQSCDPRSDLYSLGLTLYEILTLRRAFEFLDRGRLIRAILETPPPRPRSLAPDLPRDLETIVLKLIEKDPNDRYPTARALADDLRRFVAGRPIQARRSSLARRLWSWAKGHRLQASLLVLALQLPFVVAAAAFVVERFRVEAAEARASFVQAERDAAQTAVLESRFQSLLFQIQHLRTGLHHSDWRKGTWDKISEAAATRADRPELRDQITATLSGLDARFNEPDPPVRASSLTFGSKGTRLLLGGFKPSESEKEDPRSRLWNFTKGEFQPLEGAGPGPVAFRSDGSPIQLSTADPNALRLRDLRLGTDRALEESAFPVNADARPPVVALSADGSRAAAILGGAVHAWDGSTGKRVASLPGNYKALVFSNDAGLLAAGDDMGRVRVWSLPDAALRGEFVVGHTPIKALGITRNPLRDPEGRQGWLVGACDEATRLVVYDLKDRAVHWVLKGGETEVNALVFSPDATILAEVGVSVTLWDVALGRPILRIKGGAHYQALAFSPDGPRAALLSTWTAGAGRVFTLDFEEGQGALTLRGLDAAISRLAFSKDGSAVAAVCGGWKAAVWDLPSGRLRQVVDGPVGISYDNVAIALSPDGKRLALSAGSEAQLWDLTTGRRLKSWPLPAGLVDQLGFPSSDQLLSFRTEPPYGVPRPVGLIRDLLGPDPLTPLGRTPEFSPRVLCASGSADGRVFAVEGFHDVPDGPRRWCRVYDGLTGRELHSFASSIEKDYANMVIDPLGKVLALWSDESSEAATFRDLPTGRSLAVWSMAPDCLGPGGVLRVSFDSTSSPSPYPPPVLRRGQDEVLARFALDGGATRYCATFSPDGRRLALGHFDGTVTVYDLVEVNNRLSTIGMGWQP